MTARLDGLRQVDTANALTMASLFEPWRVRENATVAMRAAVRKVNVNSTLVLRTAEGTIVVRARTLPKRYGFFWVSSNVATSLAYKKDETRIQSKNRVYAVNYYLGASPQGPVLT